MVNKLTKRSSEIKYLNIEDLEAVLNLLDDCFMELFRADLSPFCFGSIRVCFCPFVPSLILTWLATLV